MTDYDVMIKARNVTKSFDGFKALDALDLTVRKGSVYGLIGPNGAGKTTFIKSLMGIYRTDGRRSCSAMAPFIMYSLVFSFICSYIGLWSP